MEEERTPFPPSPALPFPIRARKTLFCTKTGQLYETAPKKGSFPKRNCCRRQNRAKVDRAPPRGLKKATGRKNNFFRSTQPSLEFRGVCTDGLSVTRRKTFRLSGGYIWTSSVWSNFRQKKTFCSKYLKLFYLMLWSAFIPAKVRTQHPLFRFCLWRRLAY